MLLIQQVEMLQIYCQCPFQDNRLMKRWTLPNATPELLELNQPAKAGYVLHVQAAGNDTLGLQAQFDARGSTAGSACCLNVVGEWN